MTDAPRGYQKPVHRALDAAHGRFVGNRRLTVLARQLADLLPPNAAVLDVGCGDGQLTSRVAALRPDCSFRGFDVLGRSDTAIPVDLFDGQRIPAPDRSVDVVMFVDVLHHKDHRRDGVMAGTTLRIMDWVGNAHHGVRLPYNYWSERQWRQAFSSTGLTPEVWKQRLGIHGPLLDTIVGRGLHFITRLIPG